MKDATFRAVSSAAVATMMFAWIGPISAAASADDKTVAPLIHNPALNPVTFFDPPEGEPMVLVAAGRPRAVIVVAPVHDPRERHVVEKARAGIQQGVADAAEDLQHYIYEATGATLPILSSPDEHPDADYVIFVGRSRFTDARGITVDADSSPLSPEPADGAGQTHMEDSQAGAGQSPK